MSLPSVFELPRPPLSADQVTRLDALAGNLSPQALLWASGYLAGLAQRDHSSVAQPDATAAGVTLSVLYASQTGNGKRLAAQFAEICQQQGLPTRLQSLADFKPRDLARTQALLLVVSTHGDGDPPDDAIALLRHLSKLKPGQLADLSYSVLALGDSSYPHFCKTGRDFDERLSTLGAQRLAPRLECDVDLAAASADWMQALASTFLTVVPTTGVTSHAASGTAHTTDESVTATATVLSNQRLTGRHSSKDVRHLEFALDTGRFNYAPGDSVALKPLNPASVVDELLATGNWPADANVIVQGQGQTLRAALTEQLEITQVARPVLEALVASGPNADLKSWLAAATAPDVASYLASRQVVDVLRESGAALSAQGFVDLLRPLATRAYSIASSRAATPDEVHLTVSVVNGEHEGLARPGAASSFLASLDAGDEVQLSLERNPSFRLPADDATDVIMIGPGTGVAPFRAFIEERASRGAAGRHWLFFGERTQREDFLYQTEWQRHLREGSLTRLDLAFSRDRTQKEYVQDRIREQAREIHAWLEAGAFVYVCGDATRMARDVDAALRAVYVEVGGLDEEAAEDRLLELRQQGRYQRDVY